VYLVMIGNDLVVCEMCGDNLVTRITSTFLETYEGEPTLFAWFKCEVCGARWKERMVNGTHELRQTTE